MSGPGLTPVMIGPGHLGKQDFWALIDHSAAFEAHPNAQLADLRASLDRLKPDQIAEFEEIFLDVDDGFGAFELAREPCVLALQFGKAGGQRIDGRDLGSALDRVQSVVGAGLALMPPLGQGRRVQTLTPQDGADRAGCASGPIDFRQYAQLVFGLEGPATRAVHEIGGSRRWLGSGRS